MRLIILALVLFGSMTGCDQIDGPQAYTSEDGCFSAHFNGKVETDKSPGRSGTLHSYKMKDPFHERFIAFADMPPGGDPEEMLNQFVHGMNNGAASLNAKSLPIIFQGVHPGRECVAEIPGNIPRKAIERIVLVHGRIYMVSVVGVKSYVEGPETIKFLDSFKVDEAKLKKAKGIEASPGS